MGSKTIGLSASQGAAILGLSDYRTPVEVWLNLMESRQPGFCETHGYKAPERVENAPMRWGTAFEDAVCQLLAEQHGCITDREGFYTHPDAEYITCHIDGRYHDGTLHEGKTTSDMAYRIKWGEPGTNHIPSDYQAQVQHQMMCTGEKLCTVSVLVFPTTPDQYEKLGWRIDCVGDEDPVARSTLKALTAEDRHRWATVLSEMGYFHHYPVEADEVLQAKMLERYKAFWNDHVLAEAPPDARTYDDIKYLFPAPVGTIIATEQIADWAREYKEIGKEISSSGSLGKRRDQLKVEILNWVRSQPDYTPDDESQEKVVVRDAQGNKVCQFDGKTFRV